MIFVRGMVIWLIFILAESLNGAMRMFWLVPALGETRAEQFSFVTGSIVLVAIATLFIRWLRAPRVFHLFSIGLLWMGLTLAFEVSLGRVVFGYSWAQIAANFNLFKGELMPVELVLLMLAPFIATRIQSTLTRLKTDANRRAIAKEHSRYENTHNFRQS